MTATATAAATITAATTGAMTSAVTFMAGFSEVILLASVLPVGGGSRCAQAALHMAAKKSRYPPRRRSRRSLWCTASFTLAIATALVAATTLQLSPSSSAGAASPLPRFRQAPDFTGNASSLLGCRDSVHIAMTLDAAYLRGSMAVVFSVLRHSSCPGSVVFHFLASEGESELSALLRSTFPSLRFRVYHFDESLVRARISSSVRQALEQPLNYARNYLAEILDSRVRRVIYLDSDLVVVDDITKLWNTRLNSRAVIGAPEYCHANLSRYFTQAFWSDPDLSGAAFRGRNNPPCYFNTGVMVMDLERWRRRGYTRALERWMQVQKEKRIYELGSLPPFLLVFAGRVEPVAHRWNQHGLGGDNVKGSCRPLHPGPVSLLHWSGNGKPWTRLDSHKPCPVDSLWAPYDLYLPE